MSNGKILAIVVLLLSIFVLSDCALAKYAGGSGEPNDPYKIADVNNLLALAADVNDYNKSFILTADINLANAGAFTEAVIAPDTNNSTGTFDGNAFTGVFDGNNHTISNLTIDTNGIGKGYIALFGVAFGEIKNLGLENVRINSGYASGYLGGIVGRNDGTISNCHSTGQIIAGDKSLCIGGLVGFNDGIIINCHSTSNVSGGSYLGGLAGLNDGTISICYSKGTVTGGDEQSILLGGLAGYNHTGNISSCYSTGDVNSEVNSAGLGGLVGENDSNISNCHSTGAVTGGDYSNFIGGLAGYNDSGTVSNCYATGAVACGSNSQYLGGLAGYIDTGNISSCYSTGAVSIGSHSFFIGGLAGFNNAGIISNCYSTGALNCQASATWLGGLVGYNMTGTIHGCYSIGAVAGGSPQYTGGLLSYSDSRGVISSNYFLNTSGPANAYGTPLTNAKMKQQRSFAGWDFFGETKNGTNDIWWINEGADYPKLFWQFVVTKCTVTAGTKVGIGNISFSGIMDANVYDFNDANTIRVTIDSNDMVNPCVLTFPINGKTYKIKNGTYSYSGTENKLRKSFTYNLKTHKFAFAASNVILSGLDCPMNVGIEIGDYNSITDVNEAIVNGTRMPIPIKLMMGVKDVLRVDKCTVKQNAKKINTDQLTVNGAFAVKDTDANMTTRISEGLGITLYAQQFDIPVGKLKTGRGTFTCSNAKITDPNATVAATFNFNLCSFTLTIRDANIPPISDAVNFGVAFADFNEVRQVTPK
jgi:hypothetical protein